RLGFAGRNGHPYSSIGKTLLKKGILKPNELSMKSVQNWLRTHPKKARKILHANKSYIFFREIELDADLGPIGGEGVPLSARRSLAIDRRYHAYGLPLWVDTKLPAEDGKTSTPFRHLLIAQDTGAAIKGAIRGDIFFGTGKTAGEIAGRVKQTGRMFVLIPKKPKKKDK
ncbi:MAG TPA: murein transglycosylase, partial [Rhizobiales bacterium]|nr:murein transglycosylase [Hyphomicrobiales bacterium]